MPCIEQELDKCCLLVVPEVIILYISSQFFHWKLEITHNTTLKEDPCGMLGLSKRIQSQLANKQLKAIVCLTNISEKSDDSNFSTGHYFHPEVHVGF